MSILKKSSLVSLGLVMMLGLNQAQFASAETNTPSVEVTTEDGNKIGIGTPIIKSESTKLLLFNGLNSESLNLKHEEIKENNSIKQSITINPTLSGTTIEIPFEFHNGEYLILNQGEEGKTNGTGNIYNEYHESIGVISTRVVEHQDKVNLNAKIKDGDRLELNVETKNNVTEPVEIQLIASATYYSTYFSGFSWITRSGVKSLSLQPTSYLRYPPDQGEAAARAIDAWDKVYAVHSGSSNWYNTGGMEDQFLCHASFARTKSSWNLEPSRPNVSYAQTVAKACNP
ncbi:hypothetical protein JOC86_004722 [Bacillus pakistanensis]|uniref:DUF2599 domain-containing protein n=1 Tax=Rossellomorea pakistanensis TaxID=992288 RepID=A0ABS2NJV7_9BACI|nr:DUF2599 domain-containing protein [Bacillus pakistanensis]MBM7588147.1 hypothetical protein [Bacillus pakistanensis]